ncbi:malonyl-CoA-acyl carrier protein transacylase, mitochondrial-like [Babylonia areolata]|uniref:malonyl-CoA-acyl carrier protein transacylase, mitochondrial-like n=1 Tax=Babylonia areolata TaxID=304850 RepID=UPI003FD51692
MSAVLKPSFILRRPFPRCAVSEMKRFYAPRSSNTIDDDISSISMTRVPARLKKRLSKQGLSPENMEIPPAPKHADASSVTGPGFASTDHDLTQVKGLVKDMVGVVPDSTSTPTEWFPSDTQTYKEWNKQRDQSRKAFRPRVDPSKTSLILFPGQGSQFVGMGKDTLGYGKAKELFEEASAVLKYDLLKLCLSGPISTLSKTVHCQLAVLVCSLAAVEKLHEQNPEAIESCVGTAGFSVGEYAALVFAGVMDFADAVEVVRVRAEAMQQASEAVSSGMMTTFLNHTSKLKTAMLAAREFCQQRRHIDTPVCTVANYLYPECKVIAGHSEALDFVEKHARTFGIRRTKRLPVSGAFHTALMSSAQTPLGDALRKVSLHAPEVPIYSNVTASRFGRNPEKIAELLQKQVTSAVKWEQVMHVMYSRPQGQDFPASFEAGPGNQLGLMLKSVNLKAFRKYTHVDI